MKPKINLMLDSGAFNIWNRNEKPLRLKDYIAYIKRNEKWLFSYANMDSIPGVFGKPRTQEEVAYSAKKSYENLQEMKAAGLHPIPVFHQDEPLVWLERMLKDGEDYIGFSSGKDLQGDSKALWLDRVFNLVTDSKGRPFIRVHGFGITRPQYLLTYPFYSIDSTTWVLSPGYGKIFVPPHPNGKPDYLGLPETVIVSGIVQNSNSANLRQFEGMPELFMQCVESFLENEVGVTVPEVRNHALSRRKAVLHYMERLCDAVVGHNQFLRHGGDFLAKERFKLRDKSLKAIPAFRPRIMHATCLSTMHSETLNALAIGNRLLSYYDLMHKPDKVLAEYVTTGEAKSSGLRKEKRKVKNRDYSMWTEKMKRQVVRRSLELGVTLSALAEELNIHASQISRWRRIYKPSFAITSLFRNERYLASRRMNTMRLAQQDDELEFWHG